MAEAEEPAGAEAENPVPGDKPKEKKNWGNARRWNMVKTQSKDDWSWKKQLREAPSATSMVATTLVEKWNMGDQGVVENLASQIKLQAAENDAIRTNLDRVWSKVLQIHPQAPLCMVFVCPTGEPLERSVSDCATLMRSDRADPELFESILTQMRFDLRQQLEDDSLQEQSNLLPQLVKLLVDVSIREFRPDEHLLFGSGATLPDLSCALQQYRPRTLHIASPSGLTVADEEGNPVPCEENALLEAIAPTIVALATEEQMDQRPMLVVLAFQNSRGLAEHLVTRGVPCVVAWCGPVAPAVITFFSHCFHKALNLHNNQSVALAFHQARNATFNSKRKCKLGEQEHGGDGSPVIVTVSSKGYLSVINDRNPEGLTETRVVPVGDSPVEGRQEPLIGVLPFYELPPKADKPGKTASFIGDVLSEWSKRS